MKNSQNKQGIDDWLFFADADLKSAESLLTDAIFHTACFHTQQAAEKSLKAYVLAQYGTLQKTHDLVRIIDSLKQESALQKYREKINYLNQFYIPTRYPDAFPGSLPEGLPTEEDARKALQYATEVVAFIKEKIQTE